MSVHEDRVAAKLLREPIQILSGCDFLTRLSLAWRQLPPFRTVNGYRQPSDLTVLVSPTDAELRQLDSYRKRGDLGHQPVISPLRLRTPQENTSRASAQ